MHNVVNGWIFAYSQDRAKSVKLDGSELTTEELTENIMSMDFVSGEFTEKYPTKRVVLPTTHSIESSPDAYMEMEDGSYTLNTDGKIAYAAMLTGLMAQFNIKADFTHYFNGMSGDCYAADITEKEFELLKTLELHYCGEAIGEFYMDNAVFTEFTE